MDTHPDADTDTVATTAHTAAVYVEKGGVAKTTSAAHLAVAAAQTHNLDVLLINLAGTQNDLAIHFGLADEIADPDAPISAIFRDDWAFIRENIPDVVDRMPIPTGEGPDLIPADPGLGGADNTLASVPKEDRYTKLDAFLQDEIADRYDLVLLDLPGKADNISLNGLFAAENVVVPAKPGAFERHQLDALEDDLADLRDTYPVDPHLALVFATMVDQRTTLDTAFADSLADEYPTICGDPVTSSQMVSTEQADGRTLFALDDQTLSDTGQRARDAYRANATALLDQLTPTDDTTTTPTPDA